MKWITLEHDNGKILHANVQHIIFVRDLPASGSSGCQIAFVDGTSCNFHNISEDEVMAKIEAVLC